MSKTTAKRAFASPLFLICGAILIVAVVGLPATMTAISERYTKLPVDIRLPLERFDTTRFPSFSLVQPREFWMEDQDIGTDESLNLTFAMLNSSGERVSRETLLHIAYYDGTTLQVSHTPEVCYRQGGATINGHHAVRVPVSGIPGRDSVPARLVDISLPGGANLIDIYVLISNGEFYHDRERIRFAMSLASEPRVYFAKVETAAIYDDKTSREEAKELAMQMLAEALPIVIADHLPTHEDLMRVEE